MIAEFQTPSPDLEQFVTLKAEDFKQMAQTVIQLVNGEVASTSRLQPGEVDLAAEAALPRLGFEKKPGKRHTRLVHIKVQSLNFPSSQTVPIEFTAVMEKDELGRQEISLYFPAVTANPRFEETIIQELKSRYPLYDISVELPNVSNRDGDPLRHIKLYKAETEQKARHSFKLSELRTALKAYNEQGLISDKEPSRIVSAAAKIDSTLVYRNENGADGFLLREVIDWAYLLFSNPAYGRDGAYRVLFNRLSRTPNFGPRAAEAVTQIILTHFAEISQETSNQSPPPQN